MDDKELRGRLEDLHQRLERTEAAAKEKGNGMILFLVFLIFLKTC